MINRIRGQSPIKTQTQPKTNATVVLGITSDEAFDLLVNFSNKRNTKLAGVAGVLVAVADNPASSGALGGLIRELRQARPHSGRPRC